MCSITVLTMLRKITSKLISLPGEMRLRIPYRRNSTQTATKTQLKSDDVLFEEVNTAGLITLNRPKTLNSLTLPMSAQIYRTLREWESTRDLVIIRGVGDKSFCSGGDLRAAFIAINMEGGEIHPTKLLRNEYTMNYLISRYEKPYVALINGITMGAGAGLSVHGKYRIATEKTVFAMPEVLIGHFPDNGSTYFLPRLPGQFGIYLGLTGHHLKGIDVKFAGIATHYVASNKIDQLTNELIKSGGKDIDGILSSYEQANAGEFSFAQYTDKIDKYFAGNTIEEIISGLKNDGSKWAMSVLEEMGRVSPTSLKISLKAMNNGRKLSLAECLKIECRMSISTVSKQSDLHEGLRAQIIDKDFKPAWKPTRLEDVSDEYVEKIMNVIPPDGDLLIHDLK